MEAKRYKVYQVELIEIEGNEEFLAGISEDSGHMAEVVMASELTAANERIAELEGKQALHEKEQQTWFDAACDGEAELKRQQARIAELEGRLLLSQASVHDGGLGAYPTQTLIVDDISASQKAYAANTRAQAAAVDMDRMRAYVGHAVNCEMRWSVVVGKKCDCGLDALLSSPPTEAEKQVTADKALRLELFEALDAAKEYVWNGGINFTVFMKIEAALKAGKPATLTSTEATKAPERLNVVCTICGATMFACGHLDSHTEATKEGGRG
jgi:uncharacterized coiled-coil protein SlyX